MRELHDCRHCGARHASRAYCLCWRCSLIPEIRARYRVVTRYEHRGVGHPQDGRALPAEPTQARPGSAEKVVVLEQRAARGEALWHPGDDTGDGAGLVRRWRGLSSVGQGGVIQPGNGNQLLTAGPGDGCELPPEGCRPNNGEDPAIGRDVPRGGEERPIVVLIAE